MTQYNSLNVKLSNSQLNKLKFAVKNETGVVLILSSNMTDNSDDETNFPHKLLLTNRQVANLRKAFANYLSTDIKLSKTYLSKMIQLGRFLGRILGPLLKTGLLLIKSVIKPLAKSVLIPLGLTAAASAADAGIHKNNIGSGHNTTLIISNDEMKDILKTVKSLEDSELLLETVSKTIKNEAKEQNGKFLSMLVGTLGASLLGNMLAGKRVIRAGEETVRVDRLKKYLIPPQPLTNFEIQMYYQNEPKFNGVYFRDNLPDKIKDGTYVINLDEYLDIGTHWIALYANEKTVTYVVTLGLSTFHKKSINLLIIKT